MHDKKQSKQAKKQQKLEKLLAKQAHKLNDPAREPLAHTAQIEIPYTPPGTLKDLSQCPNSYDPAFVESSWFSWWEEKGVFRPSDQGEQFVIPIPPPNITGSLHIGHAMMAALQDTLIRYKRLCGYSTLYIPGTDHAGIATQSVVERKIYAETKLTREDVGRDELLKSIRRWKDLYGNKIIGQLKRIGSSLDMSRERFTLDDEYTMSVNEAFNRFYDDGIIYRERKMVNWCGKAKTTLSDLEVLTKEIKGGTELYVDGGKYKFGMLYTFRYPIIGFLENNNFNNIQIKEKHINSKSTAEERIFNNVFFGDLIHLGYVKVSTTRPETILGDVAICLNPNDKRFNFKGCKAINPITRGIIPVIFDDRCDIKFGTGILKITPNHDFTDFEIAKNHKLSGMTVISQESNVIIKNLDIMKLPKNYVNVMVTMPDYKDSICVENEDKDFLKESIDFLNSIDGMNRFAARSKVIERLKEQGLFESEDKYDTTLPTCSRTGDIIEPMIKKQWWMKCQDLAKKARDAVYNDEILLHPPESKKVWYNWLDNIRDWCLSRQLWWGHRIPAWRIYVNGSKKAWIVARDVMDLKQKIFNRFVKKEDESKEAAKPVFDANKFNELENSEGKLRFIFDNDEYAAHRDEDVLDTWFSSGLWPFAILGWPTETDDFIKYFPSSILETGSDILFFWVARMVMMSIGLTGNIPFKKILLHGIVRDAHGKKMSKSLGNIIDPLYIIEGISLRNLVDSVQIENKKEKDRAIAAQKKDFPRGIPCCGTDALRFALCTYSNGVKDINLDVLRVEGYRRMCNKLWNAFRFVIGTIETHKTNIEDDISKMDLLFLNNVNDIDYIEDLDINNLTRIESKTKDCSFKMKYFSTEGSTDEADSIIESEIETMCNSSGEDVIIKSDKQHKKLKEKNESENCKNIKQNEDLLTDKLEHLFISGANMHLLWILNRRNETIKAIQIYIDSFNFMAATQTIHKFFLHDFCDVFIEIVKRRKEDIDHKIMFVVFIDIIKMFYPFMPFITEEIFQRLRLGRKHIPLSFTFFPKTITINNEMFFDEILTAAHIIRSIIDSNKIKKSIIEIKDDNNCQKIAYYIKLLVKNVDKIEIVKNLSSKYVDETKSIKFGVSSVKITEKAKYD